ncbi:hypothetical protein HDU99_000258 [Rhizoclosmatium hyalinum]|nr:hypothetical protein HDU99_000258 [Rhizoclosmatium hyalinum]
MASTSERPSVQKAGSLEDVEHTNQTYYGFIEDAMDALFVVQGAILGVLPAFTGTAEDMANVDVRSGTVIVMAENNPYLKRWRVRWTQVVTVTGVWAFHTVQVTLWGMMKLQVTISSREIEAKGANSTQPNDDLIQEMINLSGHTGSTTGLLPSFSERTLKPNTQLRREGLTKRTISIKGSDGISYRVVSYYKASDVLSTKASERTAEKLNGHQHQQTAEKNNATLSRPSYDNHLVLIMEKAGISMTSLIKTTLPQWTPERPIAPRRNAPHALNQAVKEWKLPATRNRKISGTSIKLDETLKPVSKYGGATNSPNVTKLYTGQYFEKYHPYRQGSKSYDDYVARPSYLTKLSELHFPEQAFNEYRTPSYPSSSLGMSSQNQNETLTTDGHTNQYFGGYYNGYANRYDIYGGQTSFS